MKRLTAIFVISELISLLHMTYGLNEERGSDENDADVALLLESFIQNKINSNGVKNSNKGHGIQKLVQLNSYELQTFTPENVVFVEATYQYQRVGIDLSLREDAIIQIHLCQDALVALTTVDDSYPDGGLYEILIGGVTNTKSSIRKTTLGTDSSVAETASILSCTAPRWFWISWKFGTISVGKGQNIGYNNFLTYTDPNPIPIKFMSVSGINYGGTFVVYGPKYASNCKILFHESDGIGNMFHRPWADFKTGFRADNNNFWLGNEALYGLTTLLKDRKYKARFEMQSGATGLWYFVEYTTFVIGDESSGYQLTIGGFSTNLGNQTDYLAPHNGFKFSTYDRDSDNCAQTYASGWWYHSSCYHANFNRQTILWSGLNLKIVRSWLTCA